LANDVRGVEAGAGNFNAKPQSRKDEVGGWEKGILFLGDFAPPRLCVWPAELVPALARVRKRFSH